MPSVWFFPFPALVDDLNRNQVEMQWSVYRMRKTAVTLAPCHGKYGEQAMLFSLQNMFSTPSSYNFLNKDLVIAWNQSEMKGPAAA